MAFTYLCAVSQYRSLPHASKRERYYKVLSCHAFKLYFNAVVPYVAYPMETFAWSLYIWRLWFWLLIILVVIDLPLYIIYKLLQRLEN